MNPQRTALNVSLTPDLSEFIASLVRSGKYKSASEFVCEGLRLLKRQVPNLSPTNNKHQIGAAEEKGQL